MGSFMNCRRARRGPPRGPTRSSRTTSSDCATACQAYLPCRRTSWHGPVPKAFGLRRAHEKLAAEPNLDSHPIARRIDDMAPPLSDDSVEHRVRVAYVRKQALARNESYRDVMRRLENGWEEDGVWLPGLNFDKNGYLL